ncbi:hypothetical protein F4780DRAFT_794972 [Xylariomycetidae sp. FL0641]|nr:hypothetical protein F4780DRAFT_794972 [Xylariomycetidae sp. FL0641]
MNRFGRLLKRRAIGPGAPRNAPSNLAKRVTLSAGTRPTVGGSYRRRRRWREWEEEEPSAWHAASSKFIEGGATALGSLLILGLVGYSYNAYYKAHTLAKVENAFALGYSSLELAALSRHVDPASPHSELQNAAAVEDDDDWVPREEQEVIDRIVDGTLQGQYHLVTGEKGTGKASMLLRAMRRIGGEGVAMFEAHGDPEIFRVRLGKALDFEFHEDYVGSLFSFKGPRDTTALLDIERACDKMEKIALRRKERLGRPLVLIVTGAHLVRGADGDNNGGGTDLLELLQQRAELWAASHLVTVVFVSDDYGTLERLSWQATRLRVTEVHDVPRPLALEALRAFRRARFGEALPPAAPVLAEVYARVGGRLSFLARVARAPDMLAAADAICARQRHWLLGHYWILGADLDPGGEAQQDLAAAAMLLAKALVDRDRGGDDELPQIPLHEAQQLMTNAAWIRAHDHHNIFTVTADGMVQADSVAMFNAMREVCARPGFDAHLRATLARLDEIESLQRTRELTLKDLRGAAYRATVSPAGAPDRPPDRVVSLQLVPGGDGEAG